MQYLPQLPSVPSLTVPSLEGEKEQHRLNVTNLMLCQSLYVTGNRSVESVASPFSEPHSRKLKELLSEEARFRED